MTDMTAQGCNQHVFLRIISPMSDEARDLGISAFSKGGLYAPDVQGHRDQCVIGQVLTKGPGNVSRGELNPCIVEAGDLVLFNLFHRTNELILMGDNVSTCNWENIMAKLSVNDETKDLEMEPLQGFIICKTNELIAQRVMMGKSKIIAPYGDAQMSGNPVTDERGRPSHQSKVAVEEVVQSGPGAVVDGLWQEPTQRQGDFIMYDTSTTPVRFTAGGQTFTLVHMRHVLLTLRMAPVSPDN
jgi:co-chaperonin GroES (HSP10)